MKKLHLLIVLIVGIGCSREEVSSSPEVSTVTSQSTTDAKEEKINEIDTLPPVESESETTKNPPEVVVEPYIFSEGSGVLGSPYVIKTAEDLKHIKEKPNSYYTLRNDISLEGQTIESIGTMSKPFSGTFYGNNKTISNYTSKVVDGTTTSLFGVVSGTIVGLKMSNVIVESNGFGSALVGTLINSGFISSCSVYGTITSRLGGNGFNTGVGNGLAVSVLVQLRFMPQRWVPRLTVIRLSTM